MRRDITPIKKAKAGLIYVLTASIILCGCSKIIIPNSKDLNSDAPTIETQTPSVIPTQSNPEKDMFNKIPVELKKFIGESLNKDYKNLTIEDIVKIDTLNFSKDRFIEHGDNPDAEYDYSFLTHLNNLVHLAFDGVRMKDYSILNKCNGLKSIYLSGLTDKDTEALTGLDGLIEFIISDSNLSNINFMSNYDTLRDIGISRMPEFPLADVLNSNLFKEKIYATTLALTNMDIEEKDISAIKELVSIHYLQLQNNNIREISEFPEAKNLELIDLYDNPLSAINIPVDKAPNLKTLYLQNTGIKDLNQIKGLDNLEIIDISRTKVTSVAPLKRLKNLKIIIVKKENVTDLNVFKGTDVEIREESAE